MLIDRTHKTWIVVTGLLLVAATIVYAVYAASVPGGPTGGSWQGLLFGIAGSGLMLYAGLISVRKKFPGWRFGRAQTWLRGHIWLGLLSAPLIAFHAGFRWGGPLEQVLWAMFLMVLLTGFFGLAVQQFLPRRITAEAPHETFYEHAPHICQLMQFEADALVAESCGALPVECPPAAAGKWRGQTKILIYESEIEPEPPQAKAAADEQGAVAATAVAAKPRPSAKPRGPKLKPTEALPGSTPLKMVYLKEVRPYLAEKHARHARLADASTSAGVFARLRVELPPALHGAVGRLAELCDERRQLAAQLRLHRWLHVWLYLHVPPAVALLVLGVAHAVWALYY